MISGADGRPMIPSGTVIGGRYRLDEPTWFDSEAFVWRGTDIELDEAVAIRLPSQSNVAAEESFLNQYHLLSMIDHPGVVHVHDIGFDPVAHIYLVTEYSETVEILRDGGLTPEQTMDLVAQAADALQAVHDCDVVYRNIGKGLMMRRDGTVVLDSFHLACPAGALQLEWVATSHAAPERPATKRTDIYDLGVLAYHCLAPLEPTPSMPYWTFRPLPWPPTVPPGVRTVVEKAYAFNPGDRWPTAAALTEAARAEAARQH